MDVSFCIPTNGQKKIKTNFCLLSLHDTLSRHQVDFDYRILVCGVDPLSSTEYEFIPLEREANTGYVSKLRDKLYHESSNSDLIVYFDDDIIFPSNWSKLFNQTLKKDYSFFSNRILNADNSRYWDRCCGVLTEKGHPQVALVDYRESPASPLLYQTGGIMCVKTEVVKATPWDTSLKWDDFEDFFFSKRVIQKGVPLDFDAVNFVWHWDCNYTKLGQVVHKEMNVAQESRELANRISELTCKT